MPPFHVTIAVPDCPRTDDELDRLDGAPVGWKVAHRIGEWGTGFRLDLLGEATDPRAAQVDALRAVVVWLAENGLAEVDPVASVRDPLRSRRSGPPRRPARG